MTTIHMPGSQGFTLPGAFDHSHLQHELQERLASSTPSLEQMERFLRNGNLISETQRLFSNTDFASLLQPTSLDVEQTSHLANRKAVERLYNLLRPSNLVDTDPLSLYRSQGGGGLGGLGGDREIPIPEEEPINGDGEDPLPPPPADEECCCNRLWRWLKENILDPIGRCFQRIFCCCCDDSNGDSDHIPQDQLLQQQLLQQQIHQQMNDATQMHQQAADQANQMAFQAHQMAAGF